MSYISNRCLYCNNELSRLQKKFCCSSCAAKFNNSKRTKTTKGKTKTVNCIYCDKEIYVSLHSNEKSWLCKECKRNKLINRKLQKITKTLKPINKTYDIKDTQKICLYSPLENNICNHRDCFFFVQQICKGRTNSISQIIRNIKNIDLFRFDTTTIGTPKIIDEYYRIKNFLYHMYYDMMLSGEDIDKLAKKHIWYNLGLKVFKIKSRSLSESVSNAVIQKKIISHAENQYKTEWHKTWDNREVFLRSSYEIEYANQLDQQHVYYDVENLRIRYFDSQTNNYRCAIPDFYIPSTNTIVEIKSTWTYNEQNMNDKVKEYYRLGYNFKLILDHKEVKFVV